jgi:hypothetical protein
MLSSPRPGPQQCGSRSTAKPKAIKFELTPWKIPWGNCLVRNLAASAIQAEHLCMQALQDDTLPKPITSHTSSARPPAGTGSPWQNGLFMMWREGCSARPARSWLKPYFPKPPAPGFGTPRGAIHSEFQPSAVLHGVFGSARQLPKVTSTGGPCQTTPGRGRFTMNAPLWGVWKTKHKHILDPDRGFDGTRN